MKIFDANISGSLVVSGSAHFQSDLTVDGTINATISGTTTNAHDAEKLGGKEPSTYATTGSNLFKADQIHSGSIIPAVNVTYDLGDSTHWWKDIYVSTGSIFIGGVKAISTNSDGTIQIGAQVVQTSASLASVGLAVPPTGSVGSSNSTIVGQQNITGSQAITGSLTVSGSLAITGSLSINGTSYTAATSGTSGSSGSNGSSGTSGSSGSNGSSGTAGTSGSSGSNGSSGTSGSSGSAGTSGTSGSSGSSGTSGTSGSSGTAGTSGTSVTVSGTDNTIGKFQTNSMVNSNITDDGSYVTITSETLVKNGSLNLTGSILGSYKVNGTNLLNPTTNNIPRRSGNTLVDTNITDDGSTIKLGIGAQITGSLLITQNLMVLGSSSITYVTSSQLRVDDNIITVNTSSPGQRFGGLEVYDSGSVTQATGSILWDSLNNRWVYQQSNEATYGGGILMSGPRSSGSLGSELTLTNNRVAKSAGGDHLNDTNIIDDGTTIIHLINTEVTGSLKVTGGITGTLTGNASTVTTNANLTGNVTSVGNATTIASGVVTNAMLAGSIADTNLSTISTSGKVSNSATTATSANTVSAIVARDASGNFSAGTITAAGLTVNGAVTLNAGTTTMTGALIVGGATTSTTVGLIRASNDVIAYASSDERLKENVLTISGSLDILKQINGYRFDWVPMEGIHENEGHDIGVIAQEIEKVLPEVVTTRENGYMAVKYEKLVALLIQTNKELLARVEALEEKIK